MTPEAGSGARWVELAGRLRAAAGRAGEAVRLPPVAGAGAVLEPLETVSGCLAEGEQLWRQGGREGVEEFRRALEEWAAMAPLLRAWMANSAALAAGWAAAAGVGAGYGPGGGRDAVEPPGGLSALG